MRCFIELRECFRKKDDDLSETMTEMLHDFEVRESGLKRQEKEVAESEQSLKQRAAELLQKVGLLFIILSQTER